MSLDKSNLEYHLYEDSANIKLLNNYDIRKDRLEKEEYNKLVQSLEDMKDIQTNISDLLVDQDEKLESMNDKIYNSELELIKGIKELKEADALYFSYKAILLSGLAGAILVSPVSALIGIKWLGVTSSMGGILGGIAGYKYQK
jgi:predicted  nucleic acid-binding Zn-ribbon protein